jgi:starch synthase (maltosyl-transferring)
LHWLGNLRFHQVDNDSITAFSKRVEATDDEPADTILVVCSTDPHNVREGWTALDLPALGAGWDERFTVHDLLTGSEWEWGQFNYVRLDPHWGPAHIFEVRPSQVG